MRVHIFTEGSSTTAEKHDVPVHEYYRGLFAQVAGLHNKLAEFTESNLHVLSKEYGVMNAEETLSEFSDEGRELMGSEEMIEQAKAKLFNVANDADSLVILLSTDVFQKIVVEEWSNLVKVANPDSIWCLGAARSSLDVLDFDTLEAKGCTVLTYQRVGVARIGTETKKNLLETVKQESIK